ncbi:ROK family protein [Pseudonocardia spinosispora]|uniref:ROK family protein n=1 Tax=Pseudonocardia spinosispora TaxID=103441 RepID=UPI000686D1BF|nr:ROK family transcriptional regulator [Pseudonocardia spinosispora]
MQARSTNSAAVLRLLLGEPMSRAELATCLELTQGSVTRITAPLLDAGLITELAARGASSGRPRTPLDLVGDARYAVGVHFGLRHTTAGLTDLRGRYVEQLVHRRDPGAPEELIVAAAEMVRELVGSAPGPVIGIGATTGGQVDAESGVVLRNDLLGWRDVALREQLAQLVDRPILVDSHVLTETRAELLFGAARTESDIAYLFVGNVLELGLAIDGRVRAGSFAELVVPGPNGHLRIGEVATDRSVLAHARLAGVLHEDRGLPELAETAQRDRTWRGRVADDLLRGRAALVGSAIGQVMTLLSPSRVVVGGGLLAVPAHLSDVRAAAARIVGDQADPETIVPSGLGRHPLVTAAASTVLTSYYEDPVGWEPVPLGVPR